MCIFPLPELLYLEIYQSVCYEHFVGKNFFFFVKVFHWQELAGPWCKGIFIAYAIEEFMMRVVRVGLGK